MAFMHDGQGPAVDEELPLQLSSSENEHIMQSPQWSKHPKGHIMQVALVGMALLALLGTSFYCTGFGAISTTHLHHDDILLTKDLEELVDLDEESGSDSNEIGCDNLVFLKTNEEGVLHSNLGGKGPDEGDEGLQISGKVYMRDVDGNEQVTPVTVEIHATTPYDIPGPNKFNGLNGKFFAVKMISGKSVNLNLTILDEEKKPFSLPYFSITFFDLDMSKKLKSAEYVIAGGFTHYYIANGTQVDITEEAGRTKFKASEAGTAQDNPAESEALTIVSKNKGVMLQYEDTASLEFEVGVDEGENSARGFIFSLRPSLLCAKTNVGGKWYLPNDTSVPGILLPLMDGTEPVAGMVAPVIHILDNGTVVVENTTAVNATSTVIENGTVIDEGNGTVIIEEGSGTDKNVTVVENVTGVTDYQNGTAVVEEENGSSIVVNGTVEGLPEPPEEKMFDDDASDDAASDDDDVPAGGGGEGDNGTGAENSTVIHNLGNGTVIVETTNGTNTTETVIENVTGVTDNEDGTVTIEEGNGSSIDVEGELAGSEDSEDSDIPVQRGEKGEASSRSGTKAVLLAVAMWAAVWRLQ